VRLFLVDGTSGGLVTAEIMKWTGHILIRRFGDWVLNLAPPDGVPVTAWIWSPEHCSQLGRPDRQLPGRVSLWPDFR
jgi:hypothetical protein